ncbi:MAG: hypothetical protein EA371_12110 [Gammaproteobacteria bacterium]|nr:MAG: hypothetical protein EA371_12110 [Gammaproteobacteria bacterium]
MSPDHVIRRSQRRVLASQQDVRAAVVEVTGVAGRMLSIFTHDLEPQIYGHEDFLEAVKRFVLSRSFTRVRVLIGDPQRAIKMSHRFVAMGRRLNSYIEFRHLDPELGTCREAYLIADDSGLVFRAEASRWEGLSDTFEPAVARKYLSRFDELWAACEPSREIRELRV